ncbi:MAG: SNF2-related protein [Balneola sp.]
MELFKTGDRVETTESPVRSGTITKYETQAGGQEYYTVHLDGDKTPRYLSASELRPLVTSEDPWDRLKSGAVLNHQEFGVTSTFFKVGNNANNTISSLKASRTLFQPHQFKPLIKFLNSISKRILIADEVGLGKTIEAGHILLEMYSRKQFDNVLVICPKSLLEKWQDEMFEKFGFEFKIYETNEFAQELVHEIELNRKSIFGIITYDKLKNKKLQKLLGEQQQYSFDLIICDEAHLLRNRETKRFKAVKPIVQNAKFATMLTATPICNTREDLYNMLSILEPQRYHNYTMYLNDIETNKPFVQALNKINRGESFRNIVSELKGVSIQRQFSYGDNRLDYSETLDDAFSEDPLYQRVIDRLENEEDTLEVRIDIQTDLIELNSLNHIFTRTKKRDVIRERVIRVAHDEFVSFTPEESEKYFNEQKQVREKFDSDREATLALINVKRQVASSLPAYYMEIEQLDSGHYVKEFKDSKFEKLKEIIEKVVLRDGNKLIIFAFFKKTLRYLNLRIQDEFGIKTEFMDGGTENRSKVLQRFRDDPDFKVLISGSIGAEGLDMQFCDAIVNYDLPWNPMKIEQRIGRIDRIGQESAKIHIYNLVIRNTIEEVIYKRLLKKIRIFEESLGDLESILLDEESLGKEIAKLESDLYTQTLTQEQKEQRIEQTAKAVLQEKRNLEKVEKELQDSLINDTYFNNEIERIRTNKRYITEKELLSYIELLIQRAIPNCNIVAQEKGIYRIKTPSNNPNIIFDFIEQHVSDTNSRHSNATNKIFHDFKRKHFNAREIEITFDQELAFKDKQLEFINSYHPLVIAATNKFKKENFSVNNAYSFSLSISDLGNEINLEPGNYILALNSIQIEKEFNAEKNSFTYLYPVIADPNKKDLAFLPDNVSEHIFGVANINAEPLEAEIDFSAEAYSMFIEAVRPVVMKKLVEKKVHMEEEERIKLESQIDRIKKQTAEHYDYQIKVRKQRLEQNKISNIRPILLSEIDKLEIEKNKRMQLLEQSSIISSMNPISVSHILIKP